MTEKIQSIPARIKNIAKGGHVAGTEDIIDDASGKTQKEINTAVDNNVDSLKAKDTNLDNRLSTVEQLAEISVEGGTISIATGTDFDNPTAEQRAKVTTVGAILDGADDEPTAGSDNLVKSGGVKKVIMDLYGKNVVWEQDCYYNSQKSKTGNIGWEALNLDLSQINVLSIINVLSNGEGAYGFLIKSDGTVKQSWNNESINVTNLDVSDCSTLLLSNRKTNTSKAIDIIDVVTVLELNDEQNIKNEEQNARTEELYKELHSKIDFVPIILNVSQGHKLFVPENINYEAGTKLQYILASTDLIESDGVWVTFIYTDDTQSSAALSGINQLNSVTLSKNVKSINIYRGETGVIGTGKILFKIFDPFTLESRINDLTPQVEKIPYIEDEIAKINIKCFDNNSFVFPVVQGVGLNTTIGFFAETGETIVLYLPQTDKIESNGLNVILKYADGTEDQYATNLRVGATITKTIKKAAVGIKLIRSSTGVIGTGDVTINANVNDSLQGQINRISNGKTMYVSTSGNDSNSGMSLEAAKATINSALDSGAETILIEGGEYFMSINLDKAMFDKINIKGIIGKNQIVIKSPGSLFYNSGNEEDVSGYSNVCKIPTELSSLSPDVRFFFDGMDDVSTLISSNEVHPSQHGKTYRCDCTQVIHTTASTLQDALTEINTSDVYKWFFDNGNLYIKKPSSPTSVYPLMRPGGYSKHLLYTKKGISLTISNIQFRYAQLSVESLVNVALSNCQSKYVYGNGCFQYTNASNIKFVDCEAARCYNSNYGDGFNGSYVNGQNVSIENGGSIEITNCWSHDNNDDGFSDHDAAHTLIIGGLYEYNGKGGITPARGSVCECHDVLSRKNYCGFYYILSSSGNRGSMILYNCISDSNNRGGSLCGFRVSDGRKAILYNCIAINEDTGYFCGNAASMKLIDCKTSNCTQVKSGRDVDFTIISGQNVV